MNRIQSGPRRGRTDAGGKRNVFYAPCHSTSACRCQETDTAALRFALAWDDAARRFLSSMFADPQAGLAAGTEAGLTETDFPRPELWTIAHYLLAAADIGIQPTIRALILAAEGNGEHVGNGNARDLEWLDSLCYGSAAHVGFYAGRLHDLAARRRLADICRKVYAQCLGVTTLDECLTSIEADLRRLRGAA